MNYFGMNIHDWSYLNHFVLQPSMINMTPPPWDILPGSLPMISYPDTSIGPEWKKMFENTCLPVKPANRVKTLPRGWQDSCNHFPSLTTPGHPYRWTSSPIFQRLPMGSMQSLFSLITLLKWFIFALEEPWIQLQPLQSNSLIQSFELMAFPPRSSLIEMRVLPVDFGSP